ncbi:unnamed protein product [Prunus armeniaca]
MVCDSKFSNWVRDQAALVVLGLVKFSKDVFVGLVLMGPIVRALIQMGKRGWPQCVLQLDCHNTRLLVSNDTLEDLVTHIESM